MSVRDIVLAAAQRAGLGINWTARASNATLAAIKPASPSMGWAVRFSHFGTYDLLICTADGVTVNVATTSDGVTFSSAGNSSFATAKGASNSLRDVHVGPSGSALAIGANSVPNNLLWHTADGTTWATTGLTSFQTAMGTNGAYAVAYGAGLWVCVGIAGGSATSSDRINWVTRTSLSSQYTGSDYFIYLEFNGTRFCAVGNVGKCATSTDGLTWTTTTSLSTLVAGAADPSLVMCGAKFFAMWYDGTGAGKIARSDDNGVTWSAVTALNTVMSNTALYLGAMFFTGNVYVYTFFDPVTPANGGSRYSYDGVTWVNGAELTSKMTLSTTKWPIRGNQLPGGDRAILMYETTGTDSSYLMTP